MKQIKAFLAALLLSVAGVLSLNVGQVFAATCTWTGATNDNFNTAANWSGCGSGVPQNGDNVTFSVSSLSANKTLNNDIASLSLATITFTGTNSSGFHYDITGNALTLTTGVVANAPGYINVNVTLGASQTWSGTGYVLMGTSSSNKTLALGASNLTLSTELTLEGPITGSGNVITSGRLALMQSSASRTGTTTINSGGNVELHKADGLGASSSALTVNSGGYLAFCKMQGGTIQNPITVSGTGVSNFGALNSYAACGMGGGSSGSNPDANVTLAGALTLGANTTAYAAGVTTITGAFSGNFTLSVVSGSPGSLVVNSSNNTSLTPNGTATAPTETITVNAGDDQPNTAVNVLNNQTYVINGVRGDTRIEVGGTLKGTGTVGVLDVFGHVAPGLSPGCLSSADLSFNTGSAYEFEVGGTTACTGYDQIKVTGAVLMTGGTLNTLLVNGFKPAKGQSYTIVSNDGSDAVNGTFTSLPEGTTFTVAGYVYKISYVGGDGNDIVLTVQNVPAVPDTGFALIKNNPIIGVAGLVVAGGALILLARRFARLTVRTRR